jgi:hypothetical protein
MFFLHQLPGARISAVQFFALNTIGTPQERVTDIVDLFLNI